MYNNLNDKQIRLLTFIKEEISNVGYPPSIREICKALNYKSTSTVHLALTRLEELNYIKRNPSKTRSIEILQSEDINFYSKKTKHLPLIGHVTAGEPILAYENIEEYIPLPEEWFNANDHFILKVKGDSMINAGIFDGDIIVAESTSLANNNDIVIALVDDDTATVKRFRKDSNGIKLLPENDAYEPIVNDNIRVIGKVKTLIRLNVK